MSSTYEWARHPEGVERLRENGSPAVIHQAVAWAIQQQDGAADELADALTTIFLGQGRTGGAAVNRAVEILLDAYLEDIAEKEVA